MGFMNNLAASVLSIAANSSDPEIQQSAESLNNLRVATIGYTDNEKQQIAAAEEAKRIQEQQAEEARQKAEAEKQQAEQKRLAYMQTTEYKQNLWVNHRKNIRDMAIQFKLPQVILAQCGNAVSQECANPVAVNFIQKLDADTKNELKWASKNDWKIR